MFEKIDPAKLSLDAFDAIGARWMLLTGGTKETFNSMTISWGGLGVLWRRPAATVYVRHSRYTYDFMEKSEFFTLCLFSEKYRPQLSLMGSKSGRDMDKAAACGFTPAVSDCGAVYYEDAETVLVCRTMYSDDLEPARSGDKFVADLYSDGDVHKMYIAEIIEVLQKQ